jgi:hypothetical protein
MRSNLGNSKCKATGIGIGIGVGVGIGIRIGIIGITGIRIGIRI